MKAVLGKALLASVLVLGRDAPSGLVYAPEPGATDTQAWDVRHTFEFESLTSEIDGEAYEPMPSVELESRRKLHVEIEQLHSASSGGAPARLRRRFAELSGSLEGRLHVKDGTEEERLDATEAFVSSELFVEYQAADEEGAYRKRFVDADGAEVEGPAAVLESLSADAHMGGILAKASDVEPGSEWTAAPESLVALISPGGRLRTGLEDHDPTDCVPTSAIGGLHLLLGSDLWEIFEGPGEGELKGGIRCRIEKVKDGRAVIGLAVDVEVSRDVSAVQQGWVAHIEDPAKVTVEKATATVGAKGDGQLTWDLGAGLPVALELELLLSYELERIVELGLPGDQSVIVSGVVELQGTLESQMSVQ